MSLLNHLQFQEIEASDEQVAFDQDDEIRLSDRIDEEQLDAFWNHVVDDIHKDPSWFEFGEE